MTRTRSGEWFWKYQIVLEITRTAIRIVWDIFGPCRPW